LALKKYCAHGGPDWTRKTKSLDLLAVVSYCEIGDSLSANRGKKKEGEGIVESSGPAKGVGNLKASGDGGGCKKGGGGMWGGGGRGKYWGVKG